MVPDYLAESPLVARAWCPGCEPHADPLLEILEVRWCDQHLPSRLGAADSTVTVQGFLSGSAEAGGEANRLWCQLLHRDAARVRRARRRRRPAPAVASSSSDTSG